MADGQSLAYKTTDGLRVIDASAGSQPVSVPGSTSVKWFRSSPDSRWLEYHLSQPGGGVALHLASRTATGFDTYPLSADAPDISGTWNWKSVVNWTADGKRVAYVTQARDLFVVDTSGTAPGAPTKVASTVGAFAWSADGSSLAYHQEGKGLFARQLASAAAVLVDEVAPPNVAYDITWSKQSRIAYVIGEKPPAGTLWVATLQGYWDVQKLGSGGTIKYTWR